MSAVSSYNVGLRLNLSGQDGEQGIDVETNGYPHEQYYVSYSHGMHLNCPRCNCVQSTILRLH
jgi:hypothetical protein